jgi:excisionase family DNA binding protein
MSALPQQEPPPATRRSSRTAVAPYVTIGEAGLMLGVTRTTLYRMINAGRLQAIRTLGGHRRILRASVLALRDAMDIRPAPAASPQPAPRPAAWQPARAPAQAVPAQAGARPPRVLLVDDDQVMLTYLRHVVAHAWPQAGICTAGDTTQAVAVLEQCEAPDVVITDLNMPVDGFRLVWWLYVQPRFRHVRVLALSALASEAIGEEGGLPPTASWIAKPLQRERLVQWLAEAGVFAGLAQAARG